MGEEAFDGHILTEKLSKLNSSQQSIESLSRWCISFRKKAKQIVETWDKLFQSAQRDRRVSYLYLANDILQNSRRKGSEFVNEFWKVLPAALKHVYENGDENGKKVAIRLVDIWEERKVFGSRGQNLKDNMLGKNPSLPVSNSKGPNPIKVVKKDAHSLRIKLAVGALPEKIISAFQLVHDESVDEEAAISRCESAVSFVGEIEKDIVSGQGSLQGSELVDKLKEQEEELRHCVSQLEIAESTRITLVSHLKEALQDQESNLELIRSKLQVAQGQIEQATNLTQRLTSPSPRSLPSATTNMQMETPKTESNLYSTQLTNSPFPLQNLPPQSLPPVASLVTPKLTEEESKKAAAAAVAAKLAASTSSAQMLTSVLSSLVAEEAASMSSGLKSAGFSSSLPFAPPEKKPKVDTPMQFSEMNNPEGSNSPYFMTAQQLVNNVPLTPSGMQPVSQPNQIQAPFLPPPPPLPANTPPGQLVQSSAMMMGVMPYPYGASNLPPPPLPTHVGTGLARPILPHQQQPSQQLQSQQSHQAQQPANGGYYRPPGIGFYGQIHQTATPPVPRQ